MGNFKYMHMKYTLYLVYSTPSSNNYQHTVYFVSSVDLSISTVPDYPRPCIIYKYFTMNL